MKIKAKNMRQLHWYARNSHWHAIHAATRVLCVLNKPPANANEKHIIRVWNPLTETSNVSPEEDVEHLANCDDWDWEPEPSYTERQAASGLAVGDRVKVVGYSSPLDWEITWQLQMQQAIGRVGRITRVENNGIAIASLSPFLFPYTSLQKLPTHRSFTFAEFKEYRDRWLKSRHSIDGQLFQPGRYGDDGVYITRDAVITWEQLLADFVFEDGSLCGVEILD